MISENWRTLLRSKHQLTMSLFLVLNGIAACSAAFFPLYHIDKISLPLYIILFLCVGLLVVQWLNTHRLININITALLIGSLWAVHIAIKNTALGSQHMPFLIISLLFLLLISTLAFINHLLPFLLVTLPISTTTLWLSHSAINLIMVLAVILPIVGIAIHQRLKKRSERLTHRLMGRMLSDKRRYSDLSMLDPLTNLYNRRGFQNRLDNILQQRHGQHFLLLMDIDRFKSYNDHYGHSMGDQTLIRVSTAIRDAVRSRDIVCRYGGEEFVVLLTHTEPEQALRTADRIRQHVADLNIPHQFNDEESGFLTISIGLTPLGEDGVEAALLKADRALYRAKHHGRNRILSVDMPDTAEKHSNNG